MAEILSISGKAAPFSADPLVEALEQLVREARAGEISCFGVALVTSTGWVSTVVAKSSLPHSHVLTAAGLALLRRLEKNSGFE